MSSVEAFSEYDVMFKLSDEQVYIREKRVRIKNKINEYKKNKLAVPIELFEDYKVFRRAVDKDKAEVKLYAKYLEENNILQPYNNEYNKDKASQLRKKAHNTNKTNLKRHNKELKHTERQKNVINAIKRYNKAKRNKAKGIIYEPKPGEYKDIFSELTLYGLRKDYSSSIAKDQGHEIFMEYYKFLKSTGISLNFIQYKDLMESSKNEIEHKLRYYEQI